MFQLTTLFGLILILCCMVITPTASPTPASSDAFHVLQRRTDPVFPDSPPSCPICAQDYPGINSCAQAAPVLANFSMIIFNPGAFLDIIKCACTDTFQSAFPQCVDCFIKTNQSDVLIRPTSLALWTGCVRSVGYRVQSWGMYPASMGTARPPLCPRRHRQVHRARHRCSRIQRQWEEHS
ncbi:hypothetical protein BD779DRAFT_420511 [Infundibulicybe gibba]|nr:hypothetical protein BD779DRAFT_420511 [Infundibulicybe gibba]